jgi:hypothetical protein
MDQRFAFPGYSQANLQQASSPSPFAAGDLSYQTAAALSALIALLQPAGGGATAPRAAAAPIATLETDRRAAETLLRDITAAGLRKLLDYLETAGDKQPEMARCYRPFHAAVQAYRARNYGDALDRIYQIYRTIESLRAQRPDLPELGKTALAGGKRAHA